MGFLSIQSITPPGVVLPFAGSVAPNGWLLCQGQAVSRTTYAALFASICISFTSVTRNGTTTLTIGGGQNPVTLGVVSGMPISGDGVPAGATVSSVTSNTIVISSAASGSGTSTAAVCPYGVGDGTNTFNLPNTQGYFLRGVGTTGSYSTNRGAVQNDQMQSHLHGIKAATSDSYGSNPTLYLFQAGNGLATSQISASTYGSNNFIGALPPSVDGANGTPRTGPETRPANVGVNHIIKV
jgi:microcystin-dependent protein